MATPAYDIYLGDKASLQGYRCKSVIRDSAPLIAPRFSTGSQGQTDLDLLKSVSTDNLTGGMFQREFSDPTKVARAIGIFNNYDENLYPTPPMSSGTALSAGYYSYAKAESEIYSFISLASFGAGTYYNLLYKVNKSDNSWTSVSLPAALASNSQSNITGLTLHKGYLFIASQQVSGSAGTGYSNCQRYDISGGTFQDISGAITQFFTLRDNLYGINRYSAIYSVTNELAAGAATFTQVTTAGSLDAGAISSPPVEFNGAVYIPKRDGIFRFDGVTAIKVLPLDTYQLQVFNGAMYFFSSGWLYRFNGTTIERLQYFGNQEKTQQLGYAGQHFAASADFLYFTTMVQTGSYTAVDKFGAYASGLRRIYAYNGQSFYLLSETNESLNTSYYSSLFYTGNRLFSIFGTTSVNWQSTYYRHNLDDFFSSSAITTSSALEITTSEDDDGYPNIYKSLEAIEPIYSGLIAGDTLTVKYQLYDGKTWGSSQTLGTITSSSTSNYLEVTDFTNKIYKKIKINITLSPAAGSTAALKGVSWRYTLQPRARWRWQLDIYAAGNGTMLDRNNTPITTDSNALAINTIKSIKQKTPLFLLTPDYGLVKTGINSSATSFIIPGQFPTYTDPYNEYQLIAVQNSNSVWEIMQISSVSYNSGTDETTINIVSRGYLGITVAAINANAEVRLCYKTYITRLMRDSPILDTNVYNEQTTGESQLQREFLLEATEV